MFQKQPVSMRLNDHLKLYKTIVLVRHRIIFILKK